MSTLNERDAVRRALLEAVEGVEPRADGLQLIQARLRPPRPMALAWAGGVGTDLRMRVPAMLQDFLDFLRSVISVAWEWLRGVASVAWERFGPRRGTSSGRASRALGWLRPAVALGVTVAVVAVGAYVAIDAQQAMFPSSSNSAHSNGGAPGTGGSHNNVVGPNSQGLSGVGSAGSTPTPKPTCRPRRSGAAPSASHSTGRSLSPTAAPSNPGGGGSPSPTVTGSSSATPGVTGAVQAPLSTGGSGPAVAGPAIRTVLTGFSTATSGLPLCPAKRKPSGPTPTVRPAVVSYGKLESGS